MKMPWESAIESITGLISELTVDDDKIAEINLEIEKLKSGITSQLLSTATTPKVDATIKIMIAFKNIILPMLRPFGAACMTGFGMYCHYKEIPLDGATQVVMDGAFPAWGASRHMHKAKQLEREDWED